MGNVPLFSIVVPVYRAEAYLDACVKSILGQHWTDFELILVDDASPDTCPALCDEYAQTDARIRVIHKENGGATSARKAGTRVARGTYVCCVDSDDTLDADYLLEMARGAQAHDADVICCGSYVGENGQYRKNLMHNRPGLYTREQMVQELFPELLQTTRASYFSKSYWAKAIRTDLFRRQIEMLDESICIGEDGACIIPCVYEANSVYVIDRCLYYYRDNPKSLTKNRKAFPWDGPERIARHLEQVMDLSAYDFRDQWHRKTVHELFTVVESQFNRDEPYRVITADIRAHLQTPVYRQAIRNSHFTGKAGILAHAALKYHLFWLIWLFNRCTH